MKPFDEFPEDFKRRIDYVLTDIDGTLTINGRIPAVVFTAMERLRGAGIHTIPVTGRSAGWCDHIARVWPVSGLVGENGAFYFSYDEVQRKMNRRYFKDETQRAEDRLKLDEIKQNILQSVPGSQVAADQAFREADLAIDICEDIHPLSKDAVKQIVRCFKDAGAQVKVSSIHVNGWFGEYDKLSMSRLLFRDIFKVELRDVKDRVIFIGDSPNDIPMFTSLQHSVGVANFQNFVEEMTAFPVWITRRNGGEGFAEMVDGLLSFLR